MTRLLVATLLLLLGACPSRAAEKPVLAVINGSSDPAAAELLLAKLSAGGELVFVERARLTDVVREQKLSSASRESNVRTGQLLGADGLLFVETEAKLLHVRLVETTRGERLFDEVFPLQPFDAEACAAAVRDRLGLLAAGLRTPPRDRLYVALGPVSSARSTAVFRETLASLATLLGVRMAQQERVLIVERENLAAVSGEQSLTGKAAADLVPADAIVRGRVVDGDAEQLTLEFQIQRPAGGAPATFSAVVDRHRVAEAADRISATIGRALGVRGDLAAAESLESEAVRQYRNGQALLQAQLFEPALRYLETACLLDPANDQYAGAFLSGTAACLYSGIDPGARPDRTHSRFRAEQLYYMDRLRAAMSVAWSHPVELSAPVAKGRTFGCLGYDFGLEDDDALAQVAACRVEVRAFLERFAAADESGWDLLAQHAALFITEPRAALACLNGLVHEHCGWRVLRGNGFGRVHYPGWDQKLARQLWDDYLDKVQREPELDAQFSALLGRGNTRYAFETSFNTSGNNVPSAQRADARAAGEQFYAWLAASDEHLNFAAREENRGSRSSVWMGLLGLQPADQDRYYSGVMMRFLAQTSSVENLQFQYLSARRHSGGPRAAEDGPRIRQHIDEALAVLNQLDPALKRKALAELRTNRGLAPLVDPLDPSERLMPELPGGELLFDSAGEEAGTANYYCFAALADGDALWLAHTSVQGLALRRIDFTRRTLESYVLPLTATGSREQLCLARSATHLVVADYYRVFAFPVAKQAPFLDVSKCQITGPKFGQDDTGGNPKEDHQTTYMTGTHFRRVTGIVPAGGEVYVGLGERAGNDAPRYGAIYRWHPGAEGSELLCASDSFQPGPLNDCLPYSMVGGCAAPGGDAVYLVLENFPKMPTPLKDGDRRGLWKYTPATAHWEQLSQSELGSRKEQPRLRTPLVLDIPGFPHVQFDLASGKLRSAEGAVSGADPARGWFAMRKPEGGVSYEHIYTYGNGPIRPISSILWREFEVQSLLPTEHGLVVLLSRQEPGGPPGNRGLVYLLPHEK
jgi:hypothetical protein